MKKISILFLHSFLPIILGGFIYFIFRTKSLMMFGWAGYLGFSDVIDDIRLSMDYELPSWFLYSLPDALWVYAFLSFMLIAWEGEIKKQSIIWFLLPPLLFFGGEFLQIFNLVPGVFDFYDVFLSLIMCLVSCFLFLDKKYFLKFKLKTNE